MSTTTIATILTIVLSGGTLSALLALLLLPTQRAKLGAERESIQVASQVSLAGGYGELVQALREDRESLRDEIVRLRSELVSSRTDTESARREIKELRADLAEFRLQIKPNGPIAEDRDGPA